jgi:hypothetical protein
VPAATASPHQKNYQKRDEDYLCARFIEHIATHNELLFDKLAAISAIAFVVEVALDISRPLPETIDLRSSEFYFDGPFCDGSFGAEREGTTQ